MLIFFDIDATLLSTDGMGVRAMLQAGRDLHGSAFRPGDVPCSGRLDPLIIRDLLASSGIEPTRERCGAMRQAYARRLREAFDGSHTARPLPGAVELLDALDRLPETVPAILTGNFAETGGLKLERCGLPPSRFLLHVWGDQSPSEPPTRDDLPRVGLERYARVFGRSPPADRVWVVGDTPHDIRAARANGLRSLGVATGRYSQDELCRSGADAVVPDLSDTGRVLSILRGPARGARV